ncbi:MAG: hypothetical protein JKY95_19640, partial [Planctomycetaceae bacterium]|nr:hypothetical protein [Planctomycetaceae bacterium]
MPLGQQRILLLLLIVGCVLQIVMLLGTSIPLGVPGEWAWSRLPQDAVNYFNLVFTVLIILLYYLFLRWGAKKIQRCSSLHKTALLVMLSLASMTVLWNLKAVPGNIFGHSGMTWVTYYPRMSGYFTQAVSGEQTTQEFLANYEQAAAEGDYLHQGTHPPGLILYFRFLHNLCGSSPALTQLLLASETEDVRAGLDVLEELNADRDQAFTQDQRATLWLSILITFLVCAATVVPVFFILVRFTSANIAFALSGLWPLVPALALFAPKS